MKLLVESGINGALPCIILDPKAFAHWSDGTSITKAEQARLFHNFEKAMKFQGLKVVVENAE